MVVLLFYVLNIEKPRRLAGVFNVIYDVPTT